MQVFQILQYRNTDLVIRANFAMQVNGEQHKALSEQLVGGNHDMQKMAKEMQKDSKLIKILTVIAVLFTPASLTAVSFYPPKEYHQSLI